jgi:hypothetical protein
VQKKRKAKFDAQMEKARATNKQSEGYRATKDTEEL